MAGWFIKGAEFIAVSEGAFAFVATNSVCQGQQVPTLWPFLLESERRIKFAYPSLQWKNLATNNAGVTVVIVGVDRKRRKKAVLFKIEGKLWSEQEVDNVNPYLISGPNLIIAKATSPLNALPVMIRGNTPIDGGRLLLSSSELAALDLSSDDRSKYIREFYGSSELIRGTRRFCIWVSDEDAANARLVSDFAERFDAVSEIRRKSSDQGAREKAKRPHQMREHNSAATHTIAIPRVSSENRPLLPVGLFPPTAIIGDRNFALYDAPLWNIALIASRLHWVWIGTVCVRMRTDFSYSNTLGWNTFPVPTLTDQDKADMTRCAEDILLAREAHFPATIADLYTAETMPTNLRAAHEANDETLERIYIGRRFKNDTERLEKLFEMYTKMTSQEPGIRKQGTTRKYKKQVTV